MFVGDKTTGFTFLLSKIPGVFKFPEPYLKPVSLLLNELLLLKTDCYVFERNKTKKG